MFEINMADCLLRIRLYILLIFAKFSRVKRFFHECNTQKSLHMQNVKCKCVFTCLKSIFLIKYIFKYVHPHHKKKQKQTDRVRINTNLNTLFCEVEVLTVFLLFSSNQKRVLIIVS